MVRLLATLLVIVPLGCTRQPNPSFPVTETQAARALSEMRSAPAPLQRPLVILGGFADTGLGATILRLKIDKAFDQPDILIVTFSDCTTFEQCRQRLVRAISDRWGMANPAMTAEVDLLGASMGGLVAVFSAADFGDDAPRVNAKRIFTLSSPLRGAKLADHSPLLITPLHHDLKSDSTLYRRLQAARVDAEIYSYTRLGDPIVGEHLASLDGQSARWVDTPPLQGSHINGVLDDRVLADVLRRLRGDEPLSSDPPAPLPRGS